MSAASYKSTLTFNMAHTCMCRSVYVVAEYLYSVPQLKTLKCTYIVRNNTCAKYNFPDHFVL
jgi:hypothetical protein